MVSNGLMVRNDVMYVSVCLPVCINVMYLSVAICLCSYVYVSVCMFTILGWISQPIDLGKLYIIFH